MKAGSAATVMVTLFDVSVPVLSLPVIEASLVVVPTSSTCVQVKVSSAPTASSVVPAGVMPSQPVSFRAVNLSGTLPVFLTITWYSAVSPASPLSGPVV